MPGHRISAGERVLLSICDYILSRRSDGRKLFLFDDIDGLLHPPALKRLVRLVEETLVREREGVVLWVTHSPVMVQISNSADFFYIEKFGKSPERISKSSLVEKLTDGELIVLDNSFFVFVEGGDYEHYNALMQRFVLDGILNPSRIVRFISPKLETAAGCNDQTVTEAAAVLAKIGFSSLFGGLTDGDGKKESSHASVKLLRRYSIENYWMDPLNVYSWSLDHCFSKIPEDVRFPGILEGMGSSVIQRLNQNQLQAVVDSYAKLIAENWHRIANTLSGKSSPDLDRRRSISVYRGLVLEYPEFLLAMQGKEIINYIYTNVIDSRANRVNLREHFRRGAYWPEDLVQLMREFACPSSDSE